MTAQLDLFAAPEMPVLALRPNAHGVYPDDQAERFTLPMERKGWRGLPLAEITLLHVDAGWLSASQVQTTIAGFGHGLCDRHGGGFHPTRAKALSAAKRRILAFCIGRDDADRPLRTKIGKWVETVQ